MRLFRAFAPPATILLAAALLFTPARGWAQTAAAPVAVTGSVRPASSLTVVEIAGSGGLVAATSENEVLHLTIDPPAGAPGGAVSLRVVLALRSNTEQFALQVARSAEAGTPAASLGMTLRPRGVRAGGNGSQLLPDVLSHVTLHPLVLAPGQGGALATGGRISARGPFSSPHNALLLDLALEIAAPAAPTSSAPNRITLVFTLPSAHGNLP
jgi:hypothetical protein